MLEQNSKKRGQLNSKAAVKPMTWKQIIDITRELTEQFRSYGSIAWFRGHSDSTYELKSTLHRYLERLTCDFKISPDANERAQLLRDEYKSLYRRFKADAWPLLDPRERSDWGIIFAMQHYGLPTRLFDWTENFACAVFFAQLNRDRTKDAAVWVLDSHALNLAALGKEGLLVLDEDTSESVVDSRHWHPRWVAPGPGRHALPSIAASPLFTNARMTAQRSAFTISGDSFLPLDQEFGTLVKDGRLRKLVLPASLFDDANSFLAMCGLTAFSFYPDLQGLAMRHEAASRQRIAEAKRWYPQFFG